MGPGAILGACWLVAAMLSACCSESRGLAIEVAQAPRHLSVARFETTSPVLKELRSALAESLANRLGGLPGLTATVEGAGLELNLTGALSVRDGRLVISAQLYQEPGAEPVWSGTFWRKDSLDSALVSDLAQGVAEALYGQMAREPGSRTRGNR